MPSISAFDPTPWVGVSAAIASDVIGRSGGMDGGIRLLSGDGVLGPAHTVQTAAGDSFTVHRAVASAPPGSVLVIGAEGAQSRAVWGYVLTVAAQARGVVGVVVDGSVRDLPAIRAAGFALFARSACPAGPHKGHRGEIEGTIQCGGVVVREGDVVVGDVDGVTVVPGAIQAEVPDRARLRIEEERAWVARIRAGETSLAVLGLQ